MLCSAAYAAIHVQWATIALDKQVLPHEKVGTFSTDFLHKSLRPMDHDIGVDCQQIDERHLFHITHRDADIVLFPIVIQLRA